MGLEVEFNEDVTGAKSPYWTKETPGGGPYFLVVGTSFSGTDLSVKVPWGRVTFTPCFPLMLPHGLEDEVLKICEGKGELYIIGKDLPQMSIKEQKEYYSEVVIKLHGGYHISDGQLIKGNKPTPPAQSVYCIKCEKAYRTEFCPGCGDNLEALRLKPSVVPEEVESIDVLVPKEVIVEPKKPVNKPNKRFNKKQNKKYKKE